MEERENIYMTTECKTKDGKSLVAMKVMPPGMALELSIMERNYVQKLLCATTIAKRRLFLLQWAQQVENEIIFFEEAVANGGKYPKEYDN